MVKRLGYKGEFSKIRGQGKALLKVFIDDLREWLFRGLGSEGEHRIGGFDGGYALLIVLLDIQ